MLQAVGVGVMDANALGLQGLPKVYEGCWVRRYIEVVGVTRGVRTNGPRDKSEMGSQIDSSGRATGFEK